MGDVVVDGSIRLARGGAQTFDIVARERNRHNVVGVALAIRKPAGMVPTAPATPAQET
jgi:hypothetical protein